MCEILPLIVYTPLTIDKSIINWPIAVEMKQLHTLIFCKITMFVRVPLSKIDFPDWVNHQTYFLTQKQ